MDSSPATAQATAVANSPVAAVPAPANPWLDEVIARAAAAGPTITSKPAVAVATPEGLVDGIYFVVTHWLAPIAGAAINAAVTALIVAAGQAFEKEYRISGADIFSIFSQLLAIVSGTGDAYSVPFSGGFTPKNATLTTLIDQLTNLIV